MYTWIENILNRKKKKKTSFFGKNTHFIQNLGETSFHKRKKHSVLFKKEIFGNFGVFHNKFSFLISGSTILLLIITFMLIGPFLRVENILISKQDIITNIEQAYISVENVRGKNIFLLDTQEVIERIKNGQSAIEYIELKIKFPDNLFIELTSYSPVFQTTEHFLLENGDFIEKESRDIGNIPFIHILSNNLELSPFGNELNPLDVKNIQVLEQEILKSIPDFSTKNMFFFVSEKEILIQNNLDTLFIFDTRGDIQQQVQQLSILQKEKQELYTKKYVYIDIRIPQKLFLCGFEEEFNCKKNIRDIYGNINSMSGEKVSWGW